MISDKPTAEAIFLAAIEQQPDQRSDYLGEACGQDRELRARVERLLAAQSQAASFLECPAPEMGATVDRPVTEQPGTIIGPYTLLQQIGEGGMGVVFMAKQSAPIQRTVALKIIKPGLDTRQVIARFEAERQALAMMDHPNIARVLDVGATDAGRPYFVMDLVKGVPITEYCDAQHLPVRARLELMADVCQAVQHAHQKGIIHRDIKPSNVLVTGGLAPFAESAEQKVPVPLPAAAKKAPVPLQSNEKPIVKIIDFGVAKATAQRLTEKTVFTELGQMIGTVEYMSPEQARFNQLDIDTRSDIYSLGVLLYEILAGSTPFGRKRLNEAAFDEMLRIIREEEPPKPSTRLSSSEALPSIAANRGLEPLKLNRLVQGELDWIVMKCLEKDRNRRYETASSLGQDIGCYLNDEPVQASPPSASYRLRKFVRRNKGPALAVCAVLLALIAGVVGTTWGMLRAEQQRYLAEANARKGLAAAEAEKIAKEAAETREAETEAILEFVENKVFAAARPEGQDGGLGHDVTLRRAVEAALPFVERSFADQPLIEARLRMTLGNAFLDLGEADVAAEQLQKTRALLSKYVGPAHPNTLSSMHNLANAYAALGQHADALKLREETLALMKAKLGPDHADTLASMNNLAITYEDLGRYAEALKLREETLALRKAKHGVDHPETLGSMNNLANSYGELGRHTEALKLHEESLAHLTTKLGPEHPDTLKSMNNLAISYENLGRYDDALELHEETLKIRKAKLGPEHPDTLSSMSNLAKSYAQLGRHIEALKLDEETLALRKAKLGPDHPDTLNSMNNLAGNYRALERYDDALKLGELTLVLMKAKLGAGHRYTLASMDNLVNTYHALSRHADAVKLREERLALLNDKLGPDHPETLISMNDLAWELATCPDPTARNLDRAIELAKKTVELAPEERDFQNTLGIVHFRVGDWQAAIAALEKSMELREGGDSSDFFFLAMAHWQLGHHEEAQKWYDRATEWMDKNNPDNVELRRFRTEAAELLGITEPQSQSSTTTGNATPTTESSPKLE